MGKTILVVDDDAMNLKMAEMILKKDYEVKKPILPMKLYERVEEVCK